MSRRVKTSAPSRARIITMPAITEHLRRAVVPSALVSLSRWRTPARLSATIRRAFGGRPRIELFFAYDDPYSAIALPGLLSIAARHQSELHLYPLREHGLPGDPAAQQRRVHAVEDSRRLAKRNGRQLSRSQPIAPDDCGFLAEWTQAARGTSGAASFATASLKQIWFESNGPVTRESFQALREQHLGNISESAGATELARNSQHLLRRGHWESPAALVEGEWFFAHERLEQIEAHLQDLGW